MKAKWSQQNGEWRVEGVEDIAGIISDTFAWFMIGLSRSGDFGFLLFQRIVKIIRVESGSRVLVVEVVRDVRPGTTANPC